MKFTNDMIFDSHDKCRQGMNGSKMRSIRGWGIGGMNEFLTSLEQVSLDEGCCHTWPNICKNLWCHLLCVVYVSTFNSQRRSAHFISQAIPLFIAYLYNREVYFSTPLQQWYKDDSSHKGTSRITRTAVRPPIHFVFISSSHSSNFPYPQSHTVMV